MYFFLYKSLSTYYTNVLDATFVHKTYARVVSLCIAAVFLTYLTSVCGQFDSPKRRKALARLPAAVLENEPALSLRKPLPVGLRPAVNIGTLFGAMDLEEDLKIPFL